jgi:hypothetical protein
MGGVVMTVKDILDLLHPDVIAERVDEPHRMIREGFRVPKYVADDYGDCLRIIVGYFQYHFAGWMGLDVVMPYELALTQVKELLSRKGGFVLAVKNAVRGREGALVSAIDLIAESFRELSVEQFIDGVLTRYINPMDFDLKMRLAGEYLERYAVHVLSGEDIISAAELAGNFERIIKFHVKWVVSYRNMLT